MDGDLILIFSFIIVLAAIVFPFVLVTQRRAAEHEERKLELLARAEEAKAGKAGPDFRKLEERVRVLERLATDRGQDLAQQIEDLRGESDAEFAAIEREKVQ